MLMANVFDGLLLLTLATCIFWGRQKRRLIIVAVGLSLLQLIVEGPRVQLLPAYVVAAIFVVRLIPRSKSPTALAAASAPEGFKIKLARRVVALGAGAAVLLSAVLCLVFPRFEYPRPSGSYAVGVYEFRLTDPSRGEQDTPAPEDRREILVRAVYPASVEGLEEYPRDDVPDPAVIAARYALMVMFPGKSTAGIVPQSWGRVTTNARQSPPIATVPQRFPVLVYSHGLGSWAEQNTALVEALASHGYVVLVLNHAGLSAAFQRSDGSTLGIEPLMERSRIASAALDTGASQRDRLREIDRELTDRNIATDLRRQLIKERAAIRAPAGEVTAAAHRQMSDDQRFVLESLDDLQSGSTLLGGRLDVERIGVFGMSSGGTAAHLTCAVDPRCRAGINLDGFQALLVDVVLAVPFMHMSNERFYNHRVLHEQSTDDSYWVRILGSAHASFMDLPYTTPLVGQLDRHGIAVVGTIDGQQMLDLTNNYVCAFFDKYLKRERPRLLDDPGERPVHVEIDVR